MDCDVLIIGGGGAGFRAAVEAAQNGSRVVLLNKGPVGRSGTTTMAMEAVQAVGLPGDSVDLHFRDTVEGGRHLGDENLIRVLVQEAQGRVRDLESYGARFKKKDDGSFDPMHHPGQTFPRALFIQGGGFGLLSTLIGQARKLPGIQILSDVFVVSLILDGNGTPSGAVILDLTDGQLKTVLSGATILATGGYQELWAFNDASVTACGDGLMLAYEAGARLVDLEMVQFYPSVVIHPPAVRGTIFQYELVIHPEFLGGRLVNGRGETFTEGMPLRDALSRAIYEEVQKGRGTEHGGVFIDLTASPKSREALTEALEKWQPNQFHYLKDMGCDLREVRVEIGPHMHFALGGVQINERAQTTVPGLFACGEVAGNLHGANRVSGNALIETQVFGAQAGLSASLFARGRKKLGHADPSAHVDLARHLIGSCHRPSPAPLRPFQIRQELQKVMWSRCGIERDGAGLKKGIVEIANLEKVMVPRMFVEPRPSYPQELMEALEIKMMIPLSRLVLTSAAGRRETRGNHIRTDYPAASPEPRHIVQVKDHDPYETAVLREDPTGWKK